MSEVKETVLGVVNDLLIGLAKTGAKAAARAVDSVLEDFEDKADEVKARVKAGRAKAQTVGARPTKHIKVEVVDATLEEDEEERR